MKKLIFLSFIIIVAGFLMSYQVTHALFSDTATATDNAFTAAAEFPETPSATGSSTIVINEVSAIGGNDLDWVELYNKTGSPIDISGWKVSDNGGGTDAFPTGSVIPANGFAVIVANGSSLLVPGTALRIELPTPTIGSSGLNPDGDRVLLEDSANNDIDAISFGADTTYFTLPAITSTNSLARQNNGQDTDSSSDWALDISPSLGVGN